MGREGPCGILRAEEERKRAKSRGNQFVLHQKTWPIGKQKLRGEWRGKGKKKGHARQSEGGLQVKRIDRRRDIERETM
jgi:hypothetical protein